MLVHICCSVDSHFFLVKLQQDFPQEKFTAFFYDPNIHPYSEYQLRFLDVQRSCKKLGVEVIEGDYDFELWLDLVSGLENEPEKGKRCEVCFDRRFEVSAKKALELGEKSFTTTLLVSPLKSQEQLKKSGDIFYEKYGVEFITVDYRSNGGSQEQSRVTKEEQLYRQDYCGCIFGLTMQRAQQKKLLDEMFSPISGAILPASIEKRLEFYRYRMSLDNDNISYKIIKNKFLNYRQFNFKLLKGKKEFVEAYAFSYSTLPRKKAQGRIEFTVDNISYFNRDEIRFITLDFYNQLNKSDYQDIKELIYNPPSFEDEQKVRFMIDKHKYSLNPIIVVNKIIDSKLTIVLDAKIYEDTQEKLIIL